MNPRHEGYKAWLKGELDTENPYNSNDLFKYGTFDYHEWFIGWLEGKQDKENFES